MKDQGIQPAANLTVGSGLSLPLQSGHHQQQQLDLARVASEVLREGKHAPKMSTIAVSEASACVMYDLAMHEAGMATAVSNGDFSVVSSNRHLLVGRLMPVFGQVRAVNETSHRRSLFARHMDPIPDDDDEPPHTFAFKPVQVSTIGGDAGAGAFLAQGVVVSNRVYNYPEGDERRVVTGRSPAFEETMCWVFVTHAYPADMTYRAVGPPSTKRLADNTWVPVQDAERNKFDGVFEWQAFMERHVTEPSAGVSKFAFNDMKQTNRDITRAMLPWSIPHVSAMLRDIRRDGMLSEFLRELPMVTNLNPDNRVKRDIGGKDLRRALLLELLLTGTPLAALLLPESHADRTPEALVAALPPAPVVPDGARGLYTRMKQFCDAHCVVPAAAAAAAAADE